MDAPQPREDLGCSEERGKSCEVEHHEPAASGPQQALLCGGGCCRSVRGRVRCDAVLRNKSYHIVMIRWKDTELVLQRYMQQSPWVGGTEKEGTGLENKKSPRLCASAVK